MGQCRRTSGCTCSKHACVVTRHRGTSSAFCTAPSPPTSSVVCTHSHLCRLPAHTCYLALPTAAYAASAAPALPRGRGGGRFVPHSAPKLPVEQRPSRIPHPNTPPRQPAALSCTHAAPPLLHPGSQPLPATRHPLLPTEVSAACCSSQTPHRLAALMPSLRAHVCAFCPW